MEVARTSRSAWVRRWQSEWSQTISRRAKMRETTTPLSIIGRQSRSQVCGCLAPSRACGGTKKSMCNRLLISKGHSCIQFQSRWMISCCWSLPLCSSHQGGVRICRSGSLLAAISRHSSPRRDGPANLEAPWGHCSCVALDRVYELRNFVSRFQGALLAVAYGRLMGTDGK